MSRLNAKWHAEHRMPERATRGQRVAWHQEHQLHCACRPMPKGVLALIAAGQEGPPNPSLERTSTGKALGPRGAQVYPAPRGPSTSPAPAAQLKR